MGHLLGCPASVCRTSGRERVALLSSTGYQQLLPVAVDSGARNARYDEALEIVRAIGSLRIKLRERAEFSRELEEIRETYRAKRNFNKLLATLS